MTGSESLFAAREAVKTAKIARDKANAVYETAFDELARAENTLTAAWNTLDALNDDAEPCV